MEKHMFIKAKIEIVSLDSIEIITASFGIELPEDEFTYEE